MSNTTFPLFYYNASDNKVIKQMNEDTIVYYQIKRYADGNIMHAYGKLIKCNPDQVQELTNCQRSNEEKFNEVMKSYYNKEKENAEKIRKILFNL